MLSHCVLCSIHPRHATVDRSLRVHLVEKIVLQLPKISPHSLTPLSKVKRNDANESSRIAAIRFVDSSISAGL